MAYLELPMQKLYYKFTYGNTNRENRPEYRCVYQLANSVIPERTDTAYQEQQQRWGVPWSAAQER